MDASINGMHVAILVTDGFEQVEFTEPKFALEKEGAITKVISDKQGKIQGMHGNTPGDEFEVDLLINQADAKNFNAVLLPGGAASAGRLRTIPEAQEFLRRMDADNKPIAVICHGAWLLVSAGLVEGHTMTSWPEIQEDIRNAGGNWVDQEVVVDGYWVSSRKPEDIPAFCSKIIDVLHASMFSNLQGKADGNAVGIASS